MKRKGFTLVELLAVIVILAIILLIAVPNILGVINQSKEKAFEISVKKAFDAVNYKIMLAKSIKSGDLNSLETIDAKNLTGTWKYEDETIYLCNVSDGKYKVKGNSEGCFKENNIVIIKNDTNEDSVYVNADSTGANKPDLASNMIPVKWNGTSWIKADVNNEEGVNKWYDYNEKMWANSVTVTEASRSNYLSSNVGTVINMNDIVQMYVWIPRYKYTMLSGYHSSTAGEFDIKFENEKETTGVNDNTTPCTSGTYCIHPAFISFNARGLWVGKFESSNTANDIKIKPNEISLRSVTVSDMFDASRDINKVSNNSGFNTDDDIVDPHMMKNTEWGAVMYLTNLNMVRILKFGLIIIINIKQAVQVLQ